MGVGRSRARRRAAGLRPWARSGPLKAEELPPELYAAVGVSAEVVEDAWVFARAEDRGKVRFFLSKQFQADVVGWDEVQHAYTANARPVMALIVPDSGLDEMHKLTGEMIKRYSLQGMLPPVVTETVPIRLREGRQVQVSVTASVAIRPKALCCTYVWVFSPTTDRPAAVRPEPQPRSETDELLGFDVSMMFDLMGADGLDAMGTLLAPPLGLQ